ncbi:MAG: hypothetical protein EOM55_00220 [Clostridia bacterium]|nr:hypothetical protein [Clostridia bacterium]
MNENFTERDEKLVVYGKKENAKIAKNKKAELSNLELLKLAEKQDCESFEREDFAPKKQNFKREYEDFYNDIKQKNKFVREDW